jgi:hypothetical protein
MSKPQSPEREGKFDFEHWIGSELKALVVARNWDVQRSNPFGRTQQRTPPSQL